MSKSSSNLLLAAALTLLAAPALQAQWHVYVLDGGALPDSTPGEPYLFLHDVHESYGDLGDGWEYEGQMQGPMPDQFQLPTRLHNKAYRSVREFDVDGVAVHLYTMLNLEDSDGGQLRAFAIEGHDLAWLRQRAADYVQVLGHHEDAPDETYDRLVSLSHAFSERVGDLGMDEDEAQTAREEFVEGLGGMSQGLGDEVVECFRESLLEEELSRDEDAAREALALLWRCRGGEGTAGVELDAVEEVQTAELGHGPFGLG
jgi:hypothetical protein